MTLLGAAAVVLAGRVCRPGWVQVSGGRIAGCGPGAPPQPADLDFPGAVIVPGFVDMHVHGGGGASYAAADGAEIARAATFHRRCGTTSTLASLVTAAPDALRDGVAALAEATRQQVVAGIHLEGPWLSAARCGAHRADALRAPDPAEVDALLAAGHGAIRMVTLAPELPGAAEAIRRFVGAGVVVAVGHTDADYEQTRQAIRAGATVGTHLFNAMRPLHHREPGPALALLEDPRVTVELIADGAHLHPAVIRRVIDTAGPRRVALITDAIAAAGAGDGAYRLGGLDVDVVGGVARVRGTATIAGSTTTMDRVFRAVAGDLGASDAALATAVQVTATTPARALGLDDVGALRPGAAANLVVLDQDLRVVRVMTDGDWQPFATLDRVST
ncbi:N-acetylglucosamine-6-phosphate deacetylase [Mycobacterium sp. pUA109]|uniref:N-acetylglucosamine-6-phosphate deacetylase n=1 Tax=Mycobacterium sp. pUA109 TaxID=3238982 RepID=UPI00351B2A10